MHLKLFERLENTNSKHAVLFLLPHINQLKFVNGKYFLVSQKVDWINGIV